jgi:CheY-like chemotaxis protein
MNDYVSKPVRLEDLQAAIERFRPNDTGEKRKAGFEP